MNVVYATVNAVIPMPDGSRVVIHAGTHWPVDDPVVRQQPSMFSDDPRYGLSYTAQPEGWEEATAAPGEKRGRAVPTPPPGRGV